MKALPAKPRFMKHVEVVTQSGCWIWMAATDKDGYGITTLNTRKLPAHRAAFRLFRGEVPSDKMVLHTCDVRCCVNPSHLFLGTNQDNMDDMLRKGRKPGGVAQHLAKLNDRQVAEIRASALSSRKLAQVYGVHQTTICDARRGYTWKHVQGELS